MNYIADAIKASLALLLVLSLHILVLWQVVQHAPEEVLVHPPKPIMISLITYPPIAELKAEVQPKHLEFEKPKRIKVEKKPKRLKPEKLKRIKPKKLKAKKLERFKPKKPKQVKVQKIATSSQKLIRQQQVKSATKTKFSANQIARSRASIRGGITKGVSYKAAYLRNSYPAYPRMSRRRGEEGKVWLRVKVTENGSAASVQVKKSSGFRRLDKAACEAVDKWRFIPAKKNGKTVSAWVNIPIVFKLN